ncbi:MAG: type II secretion system protein [Bacillota bacterium]|nr:type II secretion system protein [Bacillota bacterium]
MDQENRCQHGFTLIEVLVSIILLFIVLTSFMGFFTQSAFFSNKNEQKLGTIQTAQKVIKLVDNTVSKQDLYAAGITDTDGNVLTGVYHLYSTANIEDLLNQSLNTNFNIIADISNDKTDNLILFKVTVQDSSDSNNKSVSYTYIRR